MTPAYRFLDDTSASTALILEDDTDFSLFIRQTQIPLLAHNLRTLLSQNSTTTSTPEQTYWGPQKSWDILYPGHCDDLALPSKYLSHPHLTYHDTTSPPQHILHPDTSTFLTSLNIPPQTRILHRAFFPFCTFAYAVTRHSAAQILERYNKEKEGGIDAFDVQLLEICRDQDWSCWSVSPEIFHHGVGESAIRAADSGTATDEAGGRGSDAQGFERQTWNLVCGARDRGMWVDEEDGEGRERVRGFVGEMVRRGECPINGVEGEKGWVGCEGVGCGAQS